MKRPLFLPRARYRRRRLRDAARLLPVFGGFLVLLPIMWSPGDTALPDTARAGIYLFAIWGGLIAVAFRLSRNLHGDDADPADEDD